MIKKLATLGVIAALAIITTGSALAQFGDCDEISYRGRTRTAYIEAVAVSTASSGGNEIAFFTETLGAADSAHTVNNSGSVGITTGSATASSGVEVWANTDTGYPEAAMTDECCRDCIIDESFDLVEARTAADALATTGGNAIVGSSLLDQGDHTTASVNNGGGVGITAGDATSNSYVTAMINARLAGMQ